MKKNHSKTLILSGGQTGADRAALDFAMQHRLRCGGWCPAGRLAEDGQIPDVYPLKETASDNPEERTRLNIEDSDGTLVIYSGKPDKGTEYTLGFAKKMLKPVYLVRNEEKPNPSEFRLWVEINKIKVLNVAGPRESSSPGIYRFTMEVLEELFR